MLSMVMGAVGFTIRPVSFVSSAFAVLMSTDLKQSNLLFSTETCAVPSGKIVKEEKRVN